MNTIKPLNYPKHRKWNTKVFSLPKIPRGEIGQPAVLREILKAIVNKVPYGTKMKFKGSTSKATLEDLCRWLRPIGLIYQENSVWKISEESKRYLDSEDDLYLTALFCANVRFIGELLITINTPLTIMEILKIANEEYKLNWDTKSEIGNRLTWFRQLDLVSFNDFENTYVLNEKGKEFIKNINYVHPNEIETIRDLTIEEVEVPVSSWAEEVIQMSQEELQSRKPSVGYIPGNMADIYNTFDEYIQLIYSGIDKEAFTNYSWETYKISPSSANSFVTTLSNIGFLKRKSRSIYEATSISKNWISTKSALDLVYCLHSKVLFIFEILKELEEKALSVKELAVIAKVSYGFDKERIDEIRKRLNILKSALLIQEEESGKYSVTQRAKNILKKVKLQERTTLVNKTDIEEDNTKYSSLGVDKYITELRLASKDSSNPNRFEKAIKDAFSILGFNSSWLGGSGNTDVLIHSPSIPKFSYTVTVDAKSTQSGAVNEGQINFDTLKEHKKLHSADYIAVIGFSFQGERLIKRAIEHKVALIDVDSLEKIIKFHFQTPLQADVYKKIFMQVGKIDISCLEVDRREIERSRKLLQAVMECLVIESNDTVTEGLLEEKDIYRTLRSDESFDTPPSLNEIAEVLQFLSSSLMKCVGRSKENYYAIGTVYDAMNKLDFYAKA
ncbi:hypothetical protein [Exiguobacterium acetylicum]|uniref:hypothetical protein n=1 Tax=Exiguobacterium acetylicum TaxID=41170 RepID=UPI001CA64899|nr:hypothetical protein [Exiguobacterium acetylicum]QZY86800.1 hypothetical protein K7G97_16380 [Exiguobacterium acetylicum]